MSIAASQGPETGTLLAGRRWWALAWVSISQLMVIIDGTAMNIALPSIQQDLGLTDTQRQWVIAAYALMFGALLLIGGRISDAIGRKRGLLIGLAGFTIASVVGGLAVNPEMLIVARSAQGMFGALLTPSALALLSDTFPSGPDRTRAFGVFGTIMGSGSGIGVLLGGVLTGSLGWRWVLLINVPIAIAVGVGISFTVTAVTGGKSGRIDIVGTLLSAAGFALLVLGMTNVGNVGWAHSSSSGLMVTGVMLIGAFVMTQRRMADPIMPLRLFADRRRSSAFTAMFSWGIAILPAFLFLSVYLQDIAGFSATQTGLAFLPYTVAILITVRVVRPLLKHIQPRVLLAAGLLLIAAGLGVLALIGPDSSYWAHILPIFLLLGLGTGCVQPASNSAATYQTGPDSGVASAIASTAQQVGASFGLALLGTIAATATTKLASQGQGAGLTATIYGYSIASLSGGVILTVAAIAVFLLNGKTPPEPTNTASKGPQS